MKKINLFLIVLFVISGCSQDYQGEHGLVCVTERNFELGDYEVEDYPIKYIETLSFDGKDNLITQSTSKLEFLLEEDVLNYLEKELHNDKEALLKEYMDFYMADSQDFYDDLDQHKVIYLHDRIVVEIQIAYEPIEKSWKTLIVPEDRNFRQSVERLKKIGLICEVNEK